MDAACRGKVSGANRSLMGFLTLLGVGQPPAAASAFSYDAVTFDGTNDWLSRGSALTGVSDHPRGILSFWFNPFADGVVDSVLYNNAFGVAGAKATTRFELGLNDPSFASQFIIATTSSLTAGSWWHLLASWDTNFGAGSKVGQIYLNDVSSFTVATDSGPAMNVAYASGVTDYTIMSDGFGTLGKGDVSEFYFAPAQYLDFSVTANRRKFITAGIKPVDLGSDGSTPTGVKPAVYQHVAAAGSASAFGTNQGSGGGMTINGALTIASTKP